MKAVIFPHLICLKWNDRAYRERGGAAGDSKRCNMIEVSSRSAVGGGVPLFPYCDIGIR